MGNFPSLLVTLVTDWWAIIVVGLLSICGTVAGVFFGIKWSMKSFYSQKWWERKATTYHDLLKCLNNIYVITYEIHFRKNDTAKDLENFIYSDGSRNEAFLEREYIKLIHELSFYCHVRNFTVSNEVGNILNDFLLLIRTEHQKDIESNNINDSAQCYDEVCRGAQRCIDAIKPCILKDLKVANIDIIGLRNSS